MSTPRSGYIYLIGSKKFGWYKIGKANSPKIRIGDIGILLPFKIELFAVWDCYDAFGCEQQMHIKYSESHINGEWFSFPLKTLYAIVETDGPVCPFAIRAIRIYPGPKQHHAAVDFANIEEDVIVDSSVELRKAKMLAFHEAVHEYIKENGLDHSKENLKIARIKVVEKQKEASEIRL